MALDFNGVNDLVNCGTPTSLLNLTQSDFTFMAWINATSFGEGPGGPQDQGRIFNKTTSAGEAPWTWHVNESGQTLRLQVDHTISPGRWSAPSNSVVLGTDQHVGVTWNGSTGSTPIMYIGGVSVTVTVNTSPIGAQSSDSARSFIIGNRGAQDRTFDGLIWDARVYNRILPPDEFLSIFTARGKDSNITGLQGRWPFFGEEGANRTDQLDVSINGNTGTNNPSAPHADDPNAGHW